MMAVICAAVAAIILGNATSAALGWTLFFALLSVGFLLEEIRAEIGGEND